MTIPTKNPLESSPNYLAERIGELEDMIEANPTGPLAPAIATEIERLKKLLEGFRIA